MAKAVVQRHEEFIFEIGQPSWSYGFALQWEKWRKEPYSERQTLTFKAECLYPDRFKNREADVRIYAMRDLEHVASRPSEPLKGVGAIVATKTRFEVWAELPTDACWGLGHAIDTGAVRYMFGNAPVFQPRHSFLNSLSFEGPSFDVPGYTG